MRRITSRRVDSSPYFTLCVRIYIHERVSEVVQNAVAAVTLVQASAHAKERAEVAIQVAVELLAVLEIECFVVKGNAFRGNELHFGDHANAVVRAQVPVLGTVDTGEEKAVQTLKGESCLEKLKRE